MSEKSKPIFFTTTELIAQGYSPEVAQKHIANETNARLRARAAKQTEQLAKAAQATVKREAALTQWKEEHPEDFVQPIEGDPSDAALMGGIAAASAVGRIAIDARTGVVMLPEEIEGVVTQRSSGVAGN